MFWCRPPTLSTQNASPGSTSPTTCRVMRASRETARCCATARSATVCLRTEDAVVLTSADGYECPSRALTKHGRVTSNSGSSNPNVGFLAVSFGFTPSSGSGPALLGTGRDDPGCVKTWMPGPFAQEMNPGDNTGESLLRRRSASRLNISSRAPEICFHTAWTLSRHIGRRIGSSGLGWQSGHGIRNATGSNPAPAIVKPLIADAAALATAAGTAAFLAQQNRNVLSSIGARITCNFFVIAAVLGTGGTPDSQACGSTLATQSTPSDDECWERCKHLLLSPSGDLQSSEFRKCWRECKGSQF